METLPLDVCNIIQQYKLDFELFEEQPNPVHYVSTFLAEERKIITQICALSFGNLATILRARDILDASVDLIDFYREAEKNWEQRNAVWGMVALRNPPCCSNNIGYLVYKWLCLEGDNAGMDGFVATCLLNKFSFW
jgi:hypothetical protein